MSVIDLEAVPPEGASPAEEAAPARGRESVAASQWAASCVAARMSGLPTTVPASAAHHRACLRVLLQMA